jgi:hypothetical protein
LGARENAAELEEVDVGEPIGLAGMANVGDGRSLVSAAGVIVSVLSSVGVTASFIRAENFCRSIEDGSTVLLDTEERLDPADCPDFDERWRFSKTEKVLFFALGIFRPSEVSLYVLVAYWFEESGFNSPETGFDMLLCGIERRRFIARRGEMCVEHNSSRILTIREGCSVSILLVSDLGNGVDWREGLALEAREDGVTLSSESIEPPITAFSLS